MKKIMILLVAVLSLFTSNAQRLNDLGLKMVKEFTVTKYDGRTDGSWVVKSNDRFVYGYDDNDRMISLRVYDKDNQLREEYINDGNKIKYVNGVFTLHCKYNFTKDRYGNITQFEFIELDYIDLKTPAWKTEYNFEYVYDDGDFRLNRLLEVGYDYNREKRTFIKHESYAEGLVEDFEGLLAKKGQIGFIPDYEHPNDTNVSFYGEIFPVIGLGSSYINHLMLTDWINIRSKYFPKYRNESHLEFQYDYDEKGNLVKIKIFDKNSKVNRVTTEISIKYVN